MTQAQKDSRSFWLTIIVFTITVNLVMARLTFLRLTELGANLSHSTWSGMVLLCLVISAVCLWLAIRIVRFGALPFHIPPRLADLQFDKPGSRTLGFAVFLLILILIPYTRFTFEIGQTVKNPIYDPVLLLLFHYWMCWWVILLAMAALKAALRTTWQAGFACALILLGMAYETWVRFAAVTTYPLSMGWSEGSRYYYASLYFSKWTYGGESFPLSPLHPSRYLLQSIPFLIPGLGLTAHRFWQFLLWIGMTSAAAIVITRRTFSAQ